MRRYRRDWDFYEPTYERPLERVQDEIEFLQNWKKKEEEKEKLAKEKGKKKEFPRFSFLETFSLVTVASFVAGPVVGFYYLQFLIKFVTELGVIAPLLQKSLP